jgi:hypothetical protein
VQAGFERFPALGPFYAGTTSYGVDTGTLNAYAFALNSAINAYTDGMDLSFKAASSNTGPVTININALGAKTVTRGDGAALLAGDIVAGQIVEIHYNITTDSFQYSQTSASAITSAQAAATNSAASASASSTSATNAFNYQTAASGYAVSAANSATNSATSATNSANSAAAAAASAASASGSVTYPIPVTKGGTGAITAPAALTALGGAALTGAAFAGAVTVPTVATADNSTNAASTAYVRNVVTAGNLAYTPVEQAGGPSQTAAIKINIGKDATVNKLRYAIAGVDYGLVASETFTQATYAPLAGATFTGAVSATSFSGPLTGNVSGNLTGNVTGNVSGSAGTAGSATTAGTATTAQNVSGTVGIGNGGTGATTAAGALANLGAISSSSAVFSGTTTFNGDLQMQNNFALYGRNFAGTSYKLLDVDSSNQVNLANIGGGSIRLLNQARNTVLVSVSDSGAMAVSGNVTAPTFNGNLAGNATTATSATTAGSVSGTIAIANGGTGATTASAALSNLGGVGLNAPAFTGVPTISGVAIATQGYVASQGYAPLASPNFSGTPQIAGAAIATQSYVTGQGYAPIANPVFTGSVAANGPATDSAFFQRWVTGRSDTNFKLGIATGVTTAGDNYNCGTFGLFYEGVGEVATIGFNRGGGSAAGHLSFRMAAVEKMHLDTAGNLGLGKLPATAFDVLCATNSGVRVSDGTITGIVYPSGAGGLVVGTTSAHSLLLYANNGTRATLDGSGNFSATGSVSAPTITQTSDARKKTAWASMPRTFLTSVSKLKAGRFNWKKKYGGGASLGITAQEVETFCPEAVRTDDDGFKSVNYGALAMVTCVELAREVAKLRKELEARK